MVALSSREFDVLDELRERSDGLHEHEYVTSEDFPEKLLETMVQLGLLRFFGTANRRAWLTEEGISALLNYENSQL